MNLNLLLDSGVIKELQHHDRKNTLTDQSKYSLMLFVTKNLLIM